MPGRCCSRRSLAGLWPAFGPCAALALIQRLLGLATAPRSALLQVACSPAPPLPARQPSPPGPCARSASWVRRVNLGDQLPGLHYAADIYRQHVHPTASSRLDIHRGQWLERAGGADRDRMSLRHSWVWNSGLWSELSGRVAPGAASDDAGKDQD